MKTQTMSDKEYDKCIKACDQLRLKKYYLTDFNNIIRSFVHLTDKFSTGVLGNEFFIPYCELNDIKQYDILKNLLLGNDYKKDDQISPTIFNIWKSSSNPGKDPKNHVTYQNFVIKKKKGKLVKLAESAQKLIKKIKEKYFIIKVL